MAPPSETSASTSSIQVGRTSQPWTGAENAAGFVLRYLLSMRELLIQSLGSDVLADECLKRLLAHLVTQGFGANGKGRIRDFLIRGIRSAAKAVVGELPESKRPQVDFSQWTLESPAWLAIWRRGLLTRAWRALERIEHKDQTKPVYSVLRAATEYPEADAEMLAVRVNTQLDYRLDASSVRQCLSVARTTFSQLLKHEIAETLDQVDEANVKREIEVLNLNSIFEASRP